MPLCSCQCTLEVADNGSSACIPAIYIWGLDGVQGSWLWHDPTMAVAGIWGMSQQTEYPHTPAILPFKNKQYNKLKISPNIHSYKVTELNNVYYLLSMRLLSFLIKWVTGLCNCNKKNVF